MRKFILVIALLALCFAGSAQAAKPIHGHCKPGYVKRTKTIKRHGHKRRIKICVKTKTKLTPPGRKILHAHLDPTFTQNPEEPFSVSFFYSASATEEVELHGKAEVRQAEQLPEGVLSFFLNGSLECSIEVGNQNDSGNCAVRVKEFGTQKVITQYVSGELQSTLTETETISPVTPTISLVGTYEQLPGPSDNTQQGYRVGTLHVAATVSPANGADLNKQFESFICTEAELMCVKAPFEESALPKPLFHEDNADIAVYMRNLEGILEVKLDPLPTGENSGDILWFKLHEFEDGSHYVRTSPQPAKGYAQSEAKLPLEFHPEIVP